MAVTSSVRLQSEDEVANKLAALNTNEAKRGPLTGALQSKYGFESKVEQLRETKHNHYLIYTVAMN